MSKALDNLYRALNYIEEAKEKLSVSVMAMPYDTEKAVETTRCIMDIADKVREIIHELYRVIDKVEKEGW